MDALDLIDRLQGAAARVESLKSDAARMHNTSEWDRLCGKYEGIVLAIGYVREATRDGRSLE